MVNRRVRRIAPAAERIEQHLAADFAPQAGFDSGACDMVERHRISQSGSISNRTRVR
jgi:hypothetical protein